MKHIFHLGRRAQTVMSKPYTTTGKGRIAERNRPCLRQLQKLRGLSLIEVLIATTVFSLGLAGFTALLLTSITESRLARQQRIAAMAAADLATQVRLYPTLLSRFLEPVGKVTTICNASTPCTPQQQADFDYRLWQLRLADAIPHARGLVCRDATPLDGNEGFSHCDGAGPLVIKIFWPARPGAHSGAQDNHRYSIEIS